MRIFSFEIQRTDVEVYESPNAMMVVVFVEVTGDIIAEQIAAIMANYRALNNKEVNVTIFQPSCMYFTL